MPIAILMVLWGAFMLMTAAGSPDKVKKAKEVLLYAVIGIAIAIMAQGIIFVIRSFLLDFGGGGDGKRM